MNKAAIASLLIVGFAPGLVSTNAAFAQPQAAAGQVVMEPAEQADYSAAMAQTTPAAQAPALEAYLAKYPKSQVKNYVLDRIMIDYSQVDPAKAITAADNVLQVEPNNLQAYVIEIALRKDAAEKQTDAGAKQTGLDAAASFAQKALAVAKGPAPADTPADQFKALVAYATPLIYSTIAEDALNKKDGPTAVAAYKDELAAMPPLNPDDINSTDQAKKTAALNNLQTNFDLGQAYYASTPPDYINCAFYTTRAASLAPDQFKPKLQPTANYCYKKQHGTMDGYADVVTAAKANANPPAGFTIAPAPTDKDIADQLMASTKDEDVPKLATGDKEFVLANGSDANKQKVWDSIKGKSVEIPGALVIESSPTVVKVAISDDAVQAKKADYTFNIKALEEPKEPKAKTAAALAAYKKEKAAYDKELAAIADATAVGKTVTLSGTYDSYTPNPIMITMSDGAVTLPKPAPTTPARRPVRR
jgi:hypothetical protein